MGKKYLAVTKINCLSHYTKEEAEGDAYFEKWDKLAVELKALLKKYDIDFVEHETQFLNKKKNSLCQCDECKRWMTDREKNPVGMNSEHPTLFTTVRHTRERIFVKCAYLKITDGTVAESIPSLGKW